MWIPFPEYTVSLSSTGIRVPSKLTQNGLKLWWKWWMLNIEEAVWFLSLSSQPSESKHIMGDNCELQVQPLTPAQRGDNAINTVIQFKTSGKPPTLKDKRRASPKVQSLLRE